MKYVILLLLAVSLYSTQLLRPIDHTSRNVWREVDMGSIARNFSREGMNILYPRIDWRGAGPGYVESEFPIVSWLGATFYLTFGYHEWFLRLISLLAMLGSCIVFFQLAKLLLSDKAAFLASLIFVLHPLIFLLATAVQPESMMLLGYLSAIYFFLRWIQSDENTFYLLSLFFTTAAILVKVPAAHIGIMFALLSFQKFGMSALFSLRLWFFAIVSLGIPFIWYQHARTLWEQYGNSLGISNEAFARMGKTTFKYFLNDNLIGNLAIETKKIWIGTGIFLGFAGAVSFSQNKHGKTILFWGISLFLYYIISGGTTGQDWATYYHVVTVPFACILIAEGFYYLRDYFWSSWLKRSIVNAMLLTIICVELGVFLYINYYKVPPETGNYLSAKQFKPLLSDNALIIVNGSNSVDELGRGVGGNVPYYFFWLDHKGFTLDANNQTMEHLMELKKEGAKYFVVEKKYITENSTPFYNEVFKKFHVIAESDSAYLIDLNSR